MTLGQKVLVGVVALLVGASLLQTAQGDQTFAFGLVDLVLYAIGVVVVFMLYRWLGHRGA